MTRRDRVFCLQEMVQAKRRGCDTGAEADGVTYPMVAHAGPAGDAALLVPLNATWTAGCLPPAWKEANIQPVPKPRESTKLGQVFLVNCTA